MPKTYEPDWKCARTIRAKLISDGWVSPDTYGKEFEPFTNESAVYLFLLYDTDMFDDAFIAYVGMSINIEQRMSGHNILRQLQHPGYWPMRWFRPTPKSELRKIEAAIIADINPPWNIQCRTRGVILS